MAESLELDVANIRRKLSLLIEDLREIRDQGKKASQVWFFLGMMSSVNDTYQSYDTLYHELCETITLAGESVALASDHLQRSNAKRYFHESNGYLASINESKSRESLSSASQIPVVEANFGIAWATLDETYDNKRLLATTYLDQLLDLKRLSGKPNAATLTKLVSNISETVGAFKLLDIPARMEFIYFYLANRCLDSFTREQFELQNTDTFPTFDNLVKFLRARCTAAELANGLTNVTSVRDVSHGKEPCKYFISRPKVYSGKAALMANASKGIVEVAQDSYIPNKPSTSSGSRGPLSCFVCKGPHLLSNCVKFNNSSISEHHRLLQSWKGCRNCLHYGHVLANCTSQYVCKFCKARHHSLLHGLSSSTKRFSKRPSSTHGAASSPAGHSELTPLVVEQVKPVSLNTSGIAPHDVMLGTAISNIADQAGIIHRIRLVIDSGSHFSFITQKFAKFLNLPIEPHSTGIWGIGETPFTGFIGRTHCTLTPLHTEHATFSTTALVVKSITSSLPGFDSTKELWQPYLGYNLADPEFWLIRPVDFLLGCDLFPQILTGELVSLTPNMPALLGTVFGYTVIGQIHDLSDAAKICSLHSVALDQGESLNQQLHHFWDVENPPAVLPRNPEDERCEEIFTSTHHRLPTGRYVVRLPFKVHHPQILGTRGIAIRRLEHLESKLERNPLLRRKYNEFMREYIELGLMELAESPGKVLIPHHCVTKGEGDALKLRVVFDAAARTSHGALNDYLLVGPKLQTNIVDIALNFRQYEFVFTTDVVKMFRQVLVHKDDRLYQHILWRFNPMDAVQEYELKTVTYGTASAPYLAIRAIRQVIEDEGAPYPLASKVLRSDVYVDDLVTGARTLTAALELQRQVVELLGKGEFTLGKWSANHLRLLEIASTPDSKPQSDPVVLGSSEDVTVKILGLRWNPVTDALFYDIRPPDKPVCTKRAVLSALIRIYDPLGYLGPAILLAKELVQEAWKRELDWDDNFPPQLTQRWTQFISTLPSLRQLTIPRWIVPNSGPLDILIFADASEKAYCAAAYLRVVTDDGPQMNLLLAKTKLAPVKTLTIPRLELCAALLAARLWQCLHSFCSRLPCNSQVFFFSDSMIVLSWLRTPIFKLKTFVANRIAKILKLTGSNQWRHVRSNDNPSDLGSRGILPSELPTNSFWFKGPDWALLDYAMWPPVLASGANVEIPELKVDSNLALITSPEVPQFTDWFLRFSNFNRLVRSTAYVIRFIGRCKKQGIMSNELTVDEVYGAKRVVVKLAQRSAFFGNRSTGVLTAIPKELRSLSPFLDDAGILVVGGRLKHANFQWDKKHPWILPGKSHLSKLVVEHFHKTLCHPGATLLLGVLREQFWITGARNLVERKVGRNCVACRKFNASPLQPPMGDLPAIRFGEGRAFLHTGIDFAGPFLVKDSLRRKSLSSKAYLCLFVCLSTKALHLELVSSLSTEAFVSALDRFVGRRGLPERILSDNGTNFIGAAAELRDLHNWYMLPETRDALHLYSVQKEMKWTFIPPSTPFFGGVWEAGVKSVKRLLRSVYGDNSMTYEEIATWLIRIEAILNSRPLCPLSDDPHDLDYLTPGHFLIGTPLLSPPEKSLLNLKENRLSRWQLVRQKSAHFWHRWRTEYLTTLQQRTKWQRPEYNLQVGDLVIMTEEKAPRLRWPIGRVLEVYPGSDGVVRVALIQINKSMLKRPAAKLIPLFMPNPSCTTKSNTPTEVNSLIQDFDNIKIA